MKSTVLEDYCTACTNKAINLTVTLRTRFYGLVGYILEFFKLLTANFTFILIGRHGQISQHHLLLRAVRSDHITIVFVLALTLSNSRRVPTEHKKHLSGNASHIFAAAFAPVQ